MMSDEPPGVYGTMIRIGFDGQAGVCAKAPMPAHSAVAPISARPTFRKVVRRELRRGWREVIGGLLQGGVKAPGYQSSYN